MTRQPTQNERLLAILADGHWHTTAELLHAVPCVLHSRVAELRGRGYLIEHQGAGGGASEHAYRLSVTPAVSVAVSPPAAPTTVAPDLEEQLTLAGVAA